MGSIGICGNEMTPPESPADPVTHALERHLGQPIGHVQVVQDAVGVAGFDQDEPAVVLGAILGAVGDDQ